MIQLCLCDDDDILLEKYKNMLVDIASRYEIELRISAFNSGEKLLFYLSECPSKVDIIYLDIIMANMTGVETARRLRNLESDAIIIFLTSNSDYVFEAFDVNPLNYLVKSTSNKRFEEVFLKAVRNIEKGKGEFFLCKSGALKKRIPYENITYFEVQGRIVTVHYDKKKFDFYGSMKQLEKQLNKKGFIRCQRSILVNAKYIEEIGKDALKLLDGTDIQIGQVYLNKIKVTYSCYMAQQF